MSEALPAEYGPTPPGTPDEKGVGFDPAIHQKIKATGRGLMNKAREWVRIGGRPPKKPVADPLGKPVDGLPPAEAEGDLMKKAVANSPKPIPAGLDTVLPLPKGAAPIAGIPEAGAPAESARAPGAPGTPVDGQLDATARTVTVLLEGLSMMALGPDMKHTDEEREAMAENWKQFLATKDGLTVSPGMALLIGYVALAAQRADKPTFQQKCAAWGARFKRWFAKG